MKKKNLLALFTVSLLSVSVLNLNVSAHVSDYSTDVIGISEIHLSSSHWVNKLAQDNTPLMSQTSIAQFNQNLVQNNPYIVNPLAMVERLTKAQLLEKIRSISKPSNQKRFYDNGEQLNQNDYAAYIESTNQNAVKAENTVTFGLVVRRSILRTFPTLDRVFKSTEDRDLDRFQESGLFPGDAVAILHASKDEQWVLVQAYNYLAWMPKKDVAIGNKTDISAFKNDENFIVVTGSKVFTNHVPNHAALSNIQLDMGIRLPLAKRSEYSNALYGQNPFANFIVKLPTRRSDGKLALKLVLIPRSQDLRVGYLPFTKQNLVKQSFKFLGERYGWGHDYNGRDCTGFIGEIYKSFGLLMPRNSGQQAKSDYGQNHFFAIGAAKSDKLKVIEQMQVGDLIYIPGHVMMYLGLDNSRPYIIHDVKGLGYIDERGEVYRGTLNGVSVTPLLPLKDYESLKDYVNNITNIKRIRAK
ncbi:SH3 domain-containing protein [Candidatus Colwellia aromaticivorans]|uniref:C40 family peptidase n=1 Tax=Candidatus Colwellia aromaticivorans TaxID=2267621 RepID=UPI000DF3EE1A|nr:SH3 domain-containing protein [Candidatus Colwellia aromaticivorans]